MKKFLLLSAIAVLALTSCSSDDEPKPEPVGDSTLYLAANGLTGFPEAIYDLEGNTIYQSEDGDRIKSLVAEGSDWYAVILKADGASHVVKNGKPIYTTRETIWCMAVENGSVYTVQESRVLDLVWVNKDFQHLYEVPNTVYYNTFTVDHGNVIMGVYDATACYWCNGEFIPVDGLEDGFNWVYGIDKSNDDMLITYEGINNRKNMYWWNGTSYELPVKFIPSMSQIVNGHAFILGRDASTQGVGGISCFPAIVIDGVETVLSNEEIGYTAVALATHDMDTYILTNSDSRYSLVYKNLHPIKLPDVKTPYSVGPYGSHYNQNGMTNLSALGIKDIAVVEKKSMP